MATPDPRYPRQSTIRGWRKGDRVTFLSFEGEFVRRARSPLSGAFVEIRLADGSLLKTLNDWDIWAPK